MTDILAIVVDSVKDNSYSWLLVASLPPVLYFLTKKMHGIQRRKQSWLQRLMLKWVMKRVAKRVRKGKKMSDGEATLFAILVVLGLGALLVWLLGWLWAVVIVCTAGLIVKSLGRKEYEEF